MVDTLNFVSDKLLESYILSSVKLKTINKKAKVYIFAILLKRFYFYSCNCLRMLCVSPWRTEERVRSSGATVAGSFVGAEDQTEVYWKSSMCSDLLSHLSSTYLFLIMCVHLCRGMFI